VTWDGGRVTAIVEGNGSIGVLLAHGAGTDQEHPMMSLLRTGLASGGHTVMTFNYPYTERGSKRPDRQERLIECHRAAADTLSGETDGLFLAGRSMGGRMGTYLAADGYPTRGLVLYAYPLHPAGKPEKLRVSQLSEVTVPMLFFQGTRDPLSRMELFEAHVAGLPNARVELLEGAGHGSRGGGWTLETMTERYVSDTLSWIEALPSGRSR
jgi:predicted alpha/beta-hydrolase family hydrolase